MAHDVFLSYRRSDQELARSLVQAMTAQGLDVWWDQRIEGGEDWREAIVEGLTNSDALVILFSEDCNASKQLKKELAIADTLDKEVIPILIEDTKPKGHYLYELAARNWLQIHPNPEAKVGEVANRLATELQTERGGLSGTVSKPSVPTTPETPQPPGQTVTPPGMTAPPDASPIEARTVEKVVQASRKTETARKQRRDLLPFKWYEILIAVVIGGLTGFGGFDVDTGEITSGSIVLDVFGMFFLTLLVIGMFVFPFRYYFRRRRVWHAVRFYALSLGVLIIAVGIVFGIHPDIMDETMGIVENVTVALIGSVVVFGIFGTITFGIYGLLHFQRTMRSFNKNVEAI